jgi:hypothetical protein
MCCALALRTTSRLHALARGIQPAKIVSSRERVTRLNEWLNMLWSPGWRMQLCCLLLFFCPLGIFNLKVISFDSGLGFQFVI